MANYQMIDSEVAARISGMKYLMRLIHSTRNPQERLLALNELWNLTSRLEFLVQIVQIERDKSLHKTQPNYIHPFQYIHSAAIPVQSATPVAFPQTRAQQQMQQLQLPHSPQHLSSRPTQRIQPTQPASLPGNPNGQIFTREQLAQFTGMNGMPAYVAVNGVVYDVTNNAAWSLATHFGLKAGNDFTGEFASCHAGQNWILSQMPAIGRLV